jgi:hypothetical protein
VYLGICSRFPILTHGGIILKRFSVLLSFTLLAAGVMLTDAPASRASQGEEVSHPSARVYASRQGLVGRRTANGHLIRERDRFVALPSRDVLSSLNGHEFQVLISYRGRSAIAPVWDLGPWNVADDYWNINRRGAPDLTRFMPQAEAAFSYGHNGGMSLTGRRVTAPIAMDIADGTFWDDLGMTTTDWVDVTFLWLSD